GRHRPKRVSAYTRKSVRKERPQRRPLLGVEGSSAPIWLAVHAVAIVVEPSSVIWLFATDLPTGRKRLHVVALCAARDCSLLLRTGWGGNAPLRAWGGSSSGEGRARIFAGGHGGRAVDPRSRAQAARW